MKLDDSIWGLIILYFLSLKTFIIQSFETFLPSYSVRANLPFQPSTSIHVYTHRTEIEISDKTAFTFTLWHYSDIFFFMILKNWSWLTNRSLPSVWKTALRDGFIVLIILKLVIEMFLLFKPYFPYLQFFNTFFWKIFFYWISLLLTFIGLGDCYILLLPENVLYLRRQSPVLVSSCLDLCNFLLIFYSPKFSFENHR